MPKPKSCCPQFSQHTGIRIHNSPRLYQKQGGDTPFAEYERQRVLDNIYNKKKEKEMKIIRIKEVFILSVHVYAFCW